MAETLHSIPGEGLAGIQMLLTLRFKGTLISKTIWLCGGCKPQAAPLPGIKAIAGTICWGCQQVSRHCKGLVLQCAAV